ncbi:cytoplasmic tRNA 2-thiolation protein 2 [Prunus yedoensis var. nudiflora]|uniref:Cytoplasmic tRNA 2-thiolation protein 2 n=1 Tax=Prunus yedoensis var. nudiflora TaxID=2094558 RepID=A0A314Z6E4_PRUYE|nr:cytoplasmic tRNA 2-thiolation protein 2 [Prunus yedoensis var. nudiflora]
MACSASACQSNCYKTQQEEEEAVKDNNNINSFAANISSSNNNSNSGLCLKCKASQPISSNSDGGDDARFCIDCFRGNLFGKFRFAVTSNAMIAPTDNVLVAFSGGPSSRVALQFVHEMHSKAQKNFDACRERSLPVFGVGVAFVDESSVYSVPSNETDKVIGDVRLIVENLAPPSKELYIVPIESVYSSDSGDGRERLKKLLDAVGDATGREDLLFTSPHVGLAKGCLSKWIQQTSTGVMRIEDCLPCYFSHCQGPRIFFTSRCTGSLKTVELIRSPCTGINGLVSSFVTLLQEENPSRECTIMRTAGKLIPFHFNKIEEIDDSNVLLATQRRQKRYNLKPNESFSSESFCFICNSPLSRSDLLSLKNLESHKTSSVCCSSCQFQILPQDPSSVNELYTLLPEQLFARAKHDNLDHYSALRDQIQDFLLSEGEDET